MPFAVGSGYEFIDDFILPPSCGLSSKINATHGRSGRLSAPSASQHEDPAVDSKFQRGDPGPASW